MTNIRRPSGSSRRQKPAPSSAPGKQPAAPGRANGPQANVRDTPNRRGGGAQRSRPAEERTPAAFLHILRADGGLQVLRRNSRDETEELRTWSAAQIRETPRIRERVERYLNTPQPRYAAPNTRQAREINSAIRAYLGRLEESEQNATRANLDVPGNPFFLGEINDSLQSTYANIRRMPRNSPQRARALRALSDTIQRVENGRQDGVIRAQERQRFTDEARQNAIETIYVAGTLARTARRGSPNRHNRITNLMGQVLERIQDRNIPPAERRNLLREAAVIGEQLNRARADGLNRNERAAIRERLHNVLGSTPNDVNEQMSREIRAALPENLRATFDALGPRLARLDLSLPPNGPNSTLRHLHRLATRGLDAEAAQAGLNTGEMLGQIVETLANPGLIRQGNRGTCAATTAQYFMAINHPAEYVRLVSDLLTEGRTRTAGGREYLRDPGSLARDNNPLRRDVDRIIQVTLMDQRSVDGRGRGTYDNATDEHATGLSGLPQRTVTDILNEMTGREGYFANRSYNPSALVEDMRRPLARGVEIPVMLRWDPNPESRDSLHELLVTRIEGEFVYMRNPWGAVETGGRNGPPREVVGDAGEIRMTMNDFRAHLHAASIPRNP